VAAATADRYNMNTGEHIEFMEMRNDMLQVSGFAASLRNKSPASSKQLCCWISCWHIIWALHMHSRGMVLLAGCGRCFIAGFAANEQLAGLHVPSQIGSTCFAFELCYVCVICLQEKYGFHNALLGWSGVYPPLSAVPAW
jgi:hypothetical protein